MSIMCIQARTSSPATPTISQANLPSIMTRSALLPTLACPASGGSCDPIAPAPACGPAGTVSAAPPVTAGAAAEPAPDAAPLLGVPGAAAGMAGPVVGVVGVVPCGAPSEAPAVGAALLAGGVRQLVARAWGVVLQAPRSDTWERVRPDVSSSCSPSCELRARTCRTVCCLLSMDTQNYWTFTQA